MEDRERVNEIVAVRLEMRRLLEQIDREVAGAPLTKYVALERYLSELYNKK